MRPLPRRYYDAERAAREYAGRLPPPEPPLPHERQQQLEARLLDAYRRKRRVDGLNGRMWDGSEHFEAESEIAAIETEIGGLAASSHGHARGDAAEVMQAHSRALASPHANPGGQV